MNRLSFAKLLVATAGAMAALGAASVAHARSDVHLSIGIQAPFGYMEPQPVYVQQQPVYLQPQPVYVEPQPVYVEPQRVYLQPAPVYVQQQPVYYGHHRRHHEHRGPWGDADGDGVPNRFDRAPYNPHYR